MSVTQAAQAVQRSAYRNAYAKHEQRAREIVRSVSGGTNTPATSVGDAANIITENIPWAQLLMILLGVVLIVIALLRITGADDAARLAVKAYTKGMVNV